MKRKRIKYEKTLIFADFYSENSVNIWNSTSKITYTYKGNPYTNYLGNYWSDYKGEDANGDGIDDTHYSIVFTSRRNLQPEITKSMHKDNYPLMEPWEKYVMPPEERLRKRVDDNRSYFRFGFGLARMKNAK